MKKRVIALILCLSMIVSMMPVYAHKLRLSGIEKEQALRSVLGMAKKLKKKPG